MTAPRSIPDERPPGGCLGAVLVLGLATVVGVVVGVATAHAFVLRRIGRS